jgi:membrane protein DedA with SNARE-associated domain
MLPPQIIALAVAPAARSFRHWIFHLGGLGFIPLGLLDASVFPIPGSMDLLAVVLSARQPSLWIYYAVMATIGAVIGAFVTYRVARRGGQDMLAKRLKPETLQRVQQLFDRWGLGALAIPAMLPPPVPMVPFVLAAGAMEYPVKKFLVAMALGRSVRYTILAFLAARYGRHVFSSLAKGAHPMPILVTVLIFAAAIGLLLLLRSRLRQPTTN